MDELVSDFQKETLDLVNQLLQILESIEDDFTQYKRLEEYGQIVDRIMGAAKNLALVFPDLKHIFEALGKYGELCKEVAYKGSQVGNNESLYSAVVGILFDASEMMQSMVENLDEGQPIDFKEQLSEAFLERLHWLSKQFATNLRGTVDSTKTLETTDIDSILKTFGL